MEPPILSVSSLQTLPYRTTGTRIMRNSPLLDLLHDSLRYSLSRFHFISLLTFAHLHQLKIVFRNACKWFIKNTRLKRSLSC